MRIIAGEWRGRRLPTVVERIRPTPERAREALFSILYSQGLPFFESRWLDLFAGTGAVGLEAISRGAREVVFVDASRRALEGIERFLARARARERGTVLPLQLPRGLATLRERYRETPFDVVFADPPFDERSLIEELLWEPALERLLRPEGWLILEHERRATPPETPAHWELVDERRYGRVGFWFYRPRPVTETVLA